MELAFSTYVFLFIPIQLFSFKECVFSLLILPKWAINVFYSYNNGANLNEENQCTNRIAV